MADINSSLPVRTETNGDVAAKIVDFTTPAQGLAIDVDGKISSKLNDGIGTEITSTTVGAKQALDVALKDTAGNALGSAMYPLSVSLSPNGDGLEINQHELENNVAALATATNTYTVPAGKIFFLKQIFTSGSGKHKVNVAVALDGVTFADVFVGFNSTANPNITIPVPAVINVPAAGAVRVSLKNTDLLSQDLYSTISGVEVTL